MGRERLYWCVKEQTVPCIQVIKSIIIIIIIIIIINVQYSVATSHERDVTILRNQQVRTNRTILTNKPVVIIRGNEQGTFLISSFRRVLYVVCFLLGNSPASVVYIPTFRNTLFYLHRQVDVSRMNWE